ncbi:hypothetical protein [Rhizobium herbae]
MPVIDLKDYRCSAVVDWIDLRVVTVTATQHQWLNHIVLSVQNEGAFIEPIDPSAGNVANTFVIRFQDPDFRKILVILDRIRKQKGLQQDVAVENIEISLDFYPELIASPERAKLYGFLVRHLHVEAGRLLFDDDWPRFFPDENMDTSHVLARSPNKHRRDLALRATHDLDRPAPYGATYYLGKRKNRSAYWKIMDKVLDRQNTAQGTKVELDDSGKRVRIEVTLGQGALPGLNLLTLKDLSTFNFSNWVASRYFRFMLPTFIDPRMLKPGIRRALLARTENLRCSKFMKSGVIGLQVLDEARNQFGSQWRPALTRHLIRNNKKVPAKQRVGAGQSGTLVTWPEMSRQVESALRHLKRVAVFAIHGSQIRRSVIPFDVKGDRYGQVTSDCVA